MTSETSLTQNLFCGKLKTLERTFQSKHKVWPGLWAMYRGRGKNMRRVLLCLALAFSCNDLAIADTRDTIDRCSEHISDYDDLSHRTGGTELITLFYPGRMFFRAYKYPMDHEDMYITAVLILPVRLPGLPAPVCMFQKMKGYFYRLKFKRERVI